jgi:hypothetical protein
MQDNIYIKKVGPIRGAAPSPKDPTTTIPFRIEFETDEGRAVLSLSPTVAAELQEEIEIYLQGHGSQ